MADLAVWQRTIVDEKGDIIPGAEVSVRSYPGGSLITLYEGPDGAQVKGNPFSTGADGFARFWAESQRAEIVAHGAGSTIRWVVDLLNADEVIGDAVTEATAAAADAVSEAKAEADRAEAARDAAQLNARIFPDTAAGLAATTDGDYFSVPSPDGDEYLILYLNDSGSAAEVRRYPSASAVAKLDSLKVNQGKPFPLTPIERDGIVSPAGTRNYNDFLLDAQVIGPPESIDGFYFRIGYFQNDATASGTTQKGIQIQRLPIATYATNSEHEILHNQNDTPLDYELNAGVQTLSFHPDRTNEPIEIRLTLDTDKIYPAGENINSQEADNASGSWVIDPSRYTVISPLGYDSLTINSGKPYPLRQMNVGGVISPEHTGWSNFLLDVEVIGAERGKVYQISYYQNGASAQGSPGYGWIIRERDLEGLESDTSDQLRIENLDQLAELIDRQGGVQTIRLVPTLRPNVEFKITVDAGQLPPDGTSIDSNSSETRDGWSWIVDPSRYVYPLETTVLPQDAVGVFWQVADGDLSVSWPSNGHWYRITFGPNGFNDLPNFKKSEVSSDGVAWNTLEEGVGDWLSPLVIEAVDNGDGGPSGYTGGNHGSNGDASGEQTARNIYYMIAPDGRQQNGNGSGYADHVAMVIVNELMAFNTNTLGRYVLRETFKLAFYPGGVTVTATREPYEDLLLGNDNTLQATTAAIRNSGTYMIYGGENGRIDLTTAGPRPGSGDRTSYPEAWATVFQEASAGQFVVWLDREFGAGDGRFSPASYVRFGGGTNTKVYNNIATNWTGDTPLSAGDAYQWRGGYCWSWPEQVAGFDSTFIYRKGGEAMVACAVDNEDWWTL